MLSTALICAIAILTPWANASAMVWSETADSPGEPVEFCYFDECEMTRYVTEGVSGNWSFFELANGYHESRYYSEVTGIFRTYASLNDTELGPQDLSAISLGDPQRKAAGVAVSADGRFARLTGAITKARVVEFETVLAQNPNLLGVSLDSLYGDGASALEIGAAIWGRRLSTFIAKDALCANACAVVYFSGYDREAQGWLSVSPLADPRTDSDTLFKAMWELLVHKANTDQSIMALFQTLHWNQSYSFDEQDKRSFPISRDLPGDAFNR